MSQKMRVNIYSKVMSYGLKTLPAAIASALLFTSGAYAAGLGKLTVLSSLGQPLHAEIELTSVTKEEAESLTVNLASMDAYRQANIEFNPALFSLRFATEKRGARQVVRVTSTQPINEPFVDMLLELGGSTNRLVREYTFLLDPADLRSTQPVQLASPAAPVKFPAVASSQASPAAQTGAVAQPAPAEKTAIASKQPSTTAQPAASKPAAVLQQKAEAQKPTVQTEKPVSQDQYKTKQGDTLAKIAGQYKHDGISLDQMLVALQRANPNAFVGDNINRLKTGQILSIPSAEAAGATAAGEARTIVVAQSADFNSYRSKLAAQVSAAVVQKSEEAKQSTGGKITAKVEEPASAANEAKDKLKLSNSGAAAASGPNKAGALQAGVEDQIAKDKAVADANARVKELEKNIGELQKLLEVKNKDLAEKQKQSDAAATKPATAPGAQPAAAGAPAAPNASATPLASSGNVSKSDPLVTQAETATPESDSPAVVASQPAEAAPAAQEAEAKPAVPPVAPAPVAKKPVVSPTAPAPEPSFLDELLENPTLLGAGAALLALLGGLGFYSARRRKQSAVFQDSTMLSDSSLKANSLFASTGGQSVDTNNSVFNSNFSPSASQLDTNEVDPVAEADVYIAYGRDAQAEEILKEALRTQPERNAVRVKLLEIYAQRKDVRAFESIASELYSLTKGKGEDWEQAANLGASIDPKNPMYAGGTPSDGKTSAVEKLDAPTEQLDELDLAALLNTTRGAEPAEAHAGLADASEDQQKTSEKNAVEHPVASVAPAADVDLSPADDQNEKDENRTGFLIKSASAEPEVAKQESAEPEAPAALDFDFDLSGFGIKEMELPASRSSSPDLAHTDSNTLDFEFQLDATKTVNLDENDFAVDLATESKAGDGLPALDLDVPSLGDNPNVAAATPSMDLSGISLDLDAPEMETLVASDEASAEIFNAAEMATKLDLALAYQEIGDKDGARELLDEVVKGGTAEQIEKAKAMMQKLS
jgi:pilus assembly protein FimV